MRIRALAYGLVSLVALSSLRAQPAPPYTFSKTDLALLKECDAIDQQLEKRSLIFHDPAIEKHIADLAAPLLTSPPPDHVEWKIHVLREPSPKAFGFPNGSIYLDTGLLVRMENDSQLFAVLAHEVAHIDAHHALLFNHTYRKKVIAVRVASIAASAYGFGAAMIPISQSVIGTDRTGLQAAVFGYGKDFEQTADESALAAMEHAGKDPYQLLRLAQILDDPLEPDPTGFFWEIHPTTKERENTLGKKLSSRQPAPASALSPFLGALRPIFLQTIQLDIDTRHFRAALAAAQRLAAASASDPVAFFWLGESYRALGPRPPHLTPDQLTAAGQRSTAHRERSLSENEEAGRLASTPAGKVALAENRQKAEEAYRNALHIDSAYADPFYGLGMLLAEDGHPDQAVDAFRRYIELSPQAADKDRAARRIEDINRGGKGTP